MPNSAAIPTPSTPVELPEPLVQVMARVGRAEDQARLRVVFEAAARAIGALGELDLSRYEADDEGEEAYQVWEELAPVVGETLGVTHKLVEAVEQQISESAAQPSTPLEQAMATICATQARLREALHAFRDGMRRPENMANRWDVLSYLSAFRGRSRAEIGEMIFAACQCFGSCDKANVVPHYDVDLGHALALRRALGGLAREVAILGSQMELASDEAEVKRNVTTLLGLVRGFTEGEPYRQLRVSDRRLFVHVLAVLSKDSSRAEVTSATSELFTFLKDVSINRREMVVRHDRLAVAAASESIGQARAAVEDGLRRARAAFSAALEQLGRLEGRDPASDGIIDKYRQVDVDNTGFEQLIGHLTVLEGVVRSLDG